MPSSYAVGPHFENFMNDLVKSGRYNSKSEIIRDGLRTLEEREQHRAIKLEALRKAVRKGMDSGPGIPIEDVRKELTAKYRAMSEQKAGA